MLSTMKHIQGCQYRQNDDCKLTLLCPGDAMRVCKPKGSSVVLPGIKPPSVFLLHDGVLGLFRVWQSGDETLVNLHLPGAIFGVTAILEGWAETPAELVWHVRALTSATFCRLDPDRFLSHICREPERVRGVLRQNVRQLRDAHRMAALPVRHGPEKALAHVLAILAERVGTPCINGLCISSYFTHQDLADMARLTRSTATRALHDLQRQELIQLRDKHIIVRNPDQLWRMIDEEPTDRDVFLNTDMRS